MIPKEKAEELMKKMYCAYPQSMHAITMEAIAIHHCLLLVDEVIEQLRENEISEYVDYWNEVKEEVNKI